MTRRYIHGNPDNTSATVGNVRHRKYVRVIGIAGNDWLQIRLKDGTVGFIPTPQPRHNEKSRTLPANRKKTESWQT